LGGKHPLGPAQLKPEVEAALSGFSSEHRACLMCSEGNHLDCHRHYLLAPVILELGYKIFQITPQGELVDDKGPSEKTLKRFAQFLPVTHSYRQLGPILGG
jgi:uncharacterized protein (DUF488 family)